MREMNLIAYGMLLRIRESLIIGMGVAQSGPPTREMSFAFAEHVYISMLDKHDVRLGKPCCRLLLIFADHNIVGESRVRFTLDLGNS